MFTDEVLIIIDCQMHNSIIRNSINRPEVSCREYIGSLISFCQAPSQHSIYPLKINELLRSSQARVYVFQLNS